MYGNVSRESLETVRRYLAHQLQLVDAELARRDEGPPAVPARSLPEPRVWAVERQRYDPRGIVSLHTSDCAMSIGADTITEQEAHAMVRAGKATMDCDCAR